MGMKASFHFGQDPVTYENRDVEVEAGQIDRTVTLRVVTGLDRLATPDGKATEIPANVRELCMTKGQARALASAVMGCAAEIE